MSSPKRIPGQQAFQPSVALIMASLVSATTLAGCSADLARFDMASASFNSDAPRQRTSPRPPEPLRANAGAPINEPPTDPYPAPGAGLAPPASHAPVRQAGLPEPVTREPEARRPIEPQRRDAGLPAPPRQTGSRAPAPAAPVATAGASTAGTIEVQQGDTLYGIAKRHRVSISELMTANNLQNPMIKPGQRLALPGARRPLPARKAEQVAAAPASVQPTSAPTRIAARPPAAEATPAAPLPSSTAPGGWNGTHTISPRDSLSAIARKYNVKVADLQAANGISDPTKIRAGTVLKVPGDAASAQPAKATAAQEAAPSPFAGKPTIINAQQPEAAPAAQVPERVAAATPRNPVATDAAPEEAPAAKAKPQPAAAGSGKFRWPAKGRVIANFGPRPDNTHNDGINILVPQGTDVVAAEAGTVAYAGSELKGYGNLVLIRHEGNWVSAYAHNESLLVKRGDRVERGQAIAKAGKTGAVDQPQVHFELRQGSKPVNPLPHLEK